MIGIRTQFTAASFELGIRAVAGVFLLVSTFVEPTSAIGYSRFTPIDATSAAPVGAVEVRSALTPSGAVYEVKRLARLSWDEVSDLLGVSRRSVHFWAAGQRPSAEKERQLFTLLAAMRHLSSGESAQNRADLLSVGRNGETLFGKLKECRFGEVTGGVIPTTEVSLKSVSAAEAKLRRPVAFADIVNSDSSPLSFRTGPAKALRLNRSA